LRLLASLNELTNEDRLHAMEHLGASLEHFVSATAIDGWLNPKHGDG
jgi:hypothetical protein